MSKSKGLTNDLLKSKMVDAMVTRGSFTSAVDLNNVRTPGCYLLNSPDLSMRIITNSPKSTQRGFLLVCAYGAALLQVVFSREPYKFIAYRIDWFGVAWTDWQIFSPSA